MSIDQLSLDLRRAYRMVHSYQRAILDLTQRLGSELGLIFYHWEPALQGRPARSSSQPAGNWAWDMLPLYNATFTYISPDAIKRGSSMVVISVEADTGYQEIWDATTRGEPDFRKMREAGETQTRLGFWYITVKEGPGKRKPDAVWDSFFNEEWPDEQFFRLKIEDWSVEGGMLYLPLSKFVDEETMRQTIGELKDRLKLKDSGTEAAAY